MGVGRLISSYIYRRALNGNAITRRLFRIARRVLVQMHEDALCTMNVHGRDMLMPLAHPLPSHLRDFPLYDRLPGRLTKFIRSKLQTIRCIDVGANVGDTIAAFRGPTIQEKSTEEDIFLAIEPNPRFRRCLISNWGDDESVVILPCICSSSEGETSARIHEAKGTASIDLAGEADGEQGNQHTKRTIDSIVSQYRGRGDFNLLKIDTDGHDFEVLSGAKEFIAKSMPFLYFEVDAFSNPSFIDDCFNALGFLRETGYRRMFIYDNFGSLLGIFETDDVASVKKLLFYKLTKAGYYFDFLLMKECFVDEFYRLEGDYFLSEIKDERLSQVL
jgi:FkbM family methyltransferase